MQQGPIGRRYAKALLLALQSATAGAAHEINAKLQQVEEQLTALAALLDKRTGNADFRQAMLNPSFSTPQRRAVLDQIAKAHTFDAATSTFLQLLAEKGRLPQLPAIAASFRAEVDQTIGRVRATIVTAKALDAAALNDIVRGLQKRTGKTVIPEVEIDPSVIAGVQAKIGGLVFDATVRAQLSRLHAEFQVQ